jgi:hypothetical protein
VGVAVALSLGSSLRPTKLAQALGTVPCVALERLDPRRSVPGEVVGDPVVRKAVVEPIRTITSETVEIVSRRRCRLHGAALSSEAAMVPA